MSSVFVFSRHCFLGKEIYSKLRRIVLYMSYFAFYLLREEVERHKMRRTTYHEKASSCFSIYRQATQVSHSLTYRPRSFIILLVLNVSLLVNFIARFSNKIWIVILIPPSLLFTSEYYFFVPRSHRRL